MILHIAKNPPRDLLLNNFVRDKLAYSENQASKNLKLYRVKQKEVGIFTFPDQDSKSLKTLP